MTCNHSRSIQTLLMEVFKMKNELAPPIMESILRKIFNIYNLGTFKSLRREEKEPVAMVLKPSATVMLNFRPFCQKAPKEMNSLIQLKKILSIGYAVTGLAGFVKFIFKILDFCIVKSYTFVKFANLATNCQIN